MANDKILLSPRFLWIWILICIYICIYVIYVCFGVCNRKCSQGTSIQSQSDRQQSDLLDLDLRPYVLPITDHPTAPFQDQRDHQWRIVMSELQQLQVDLRPVPNGNSVTPSAPRLDQVDLPPSYEEAIKIKVSSGSF